MENEKGIKFQLMTRTEAVKFLSERNNYLRIASYRKNYRTYNGKYCGLDFKHLVELSTIDMHLRNLIMRMAISIEHCLKVRLLNDITKSSQENGYSIVSEFLSLPENGFVINDILRKSSSQYSGDLIRHYFNFDQSGVECSEFDCPVWVFLEVISFGVFIKFYKHYYDKNGNFPINAKLLNSVKSLRNACAHNNCIMHDLNPSKNTKPKAEINNIISQIPSIGNNQRNKKLSNQFILEFVTLLYVYNLLVSPDMKKHTYEDLKNFADHRLIRHIDYFNNQPLVKSSIEFLRKVIDFFAK